MPSSSTSFSSCSVKLIRNCIPSLHLFSTSSRPPTRKESNKGPVDIIEAVCIEAFGLTAHTEAEAKWVMTKYIHMFFDRESTVVITKLNNLSESALTTYCQNFGTVIRCYIRNASQSRNKDPYALIKFAEASSVTSILTNRNHVINGTHVVLRVYHQDTNNSGAVPSLMSLSQKNSTSSVQTPTHHDQLVQENTALKYDIANLQKSLAEAQTYSKTAYDTFQALREKFEAEQIITAKIKVEHATMIDSYEARLKQIPTQPAPTPVKMIEKDKVKEEPIDCDSHQTNLSNQLLEMQIIKDCLEQTQIDLGKCQTENAILNAKLSSREQQHELRVKELNNQYTRMKRQYDHVSSCIKDFHSKLYQKKRLKPEMKQETVNKSDGANDEFNNDSSDDVVEIPKNHSTMT